MLIEAFQQYFVAAELELTIFIKNLQLFKLPFDDFFAQMRRLARPGYPTFECGLPPTFYYFVAGTRWGSDKPIPPIPLDPEFVYSADGTGMNFGCPIRLHKALKILSSLDAADTEECCRNLAQPMQHLAAVEELLWLEVWQSPKTVNRSEGIPSRTHDWRLRLASVELRIECKFRPVDWLRALDGDDLQFFDGYLLGKASKQLPIDDTTSINIVCFTGIDRVSPALQNLAATELSTNPHISVLIFRTLANEISIFSLSERIVQTMAALIPPQPVSPFYGVIRNIAACNQRETALQNKRCNKTRDSQAVFEYRVRNIIPSVKYRLPELPYRFKLTGRLPSGEPQFEVVVPFITKEEAMA